MDVRWFLALSIGALVLFFALGHWRRRRRLNRRAQLRAQPLSPDQIRTLQRRVPLYMRLPRPLQADLHANIQVFLDEKAFYGRGGLQVTEEMRLTVAGNACMLLLNRPHDGFPGFTSILLYPDTVLATDAVEDGHVVTEFTDHRAGESWHRGPVILSWQDVLHGAQGQGDGFNVVLHEFAHKLDEANGLTEGNPVRGSTAYREWAEVFSQAYQQFQERIDDQADPAIDDYGATSPEEFFAVCTESFFEKPQLLKRDWPQLYQQLARFYALDPAAW